MYQIPEYAARGSFFEESEEMIESRPLSFLTKAWQALTSLFSNPTQNQIKIPVAQPLSYAREFVQYRINGIALSSGNDYQNLLLMRMGYIKDDLSRFNPRRPSLDLAIEAFEEAMYNYENSDQATGILDLREPLYNFYRQASLVVLPPSAPFFPDDVGPNNFQKVADALAQIYYENLELTLDDVKNCLRTFFPTDDDLEQLTPAIIQGIIHCKSVQGGMALLTLLPTKNILDVAVEQLKLEKLNFFARIARVTINFFDGLMQTISRGLRGNGTNSPNDYASEDFGHIQPNNDPNHRYRQVVARTLDKYISWWKMSWFGHHHDERARHLKAEILNPRSSVEKIRALLESEGSLINPQNYTEDNSWRGPMCTYGFEDDAINARWNNPETVVHHTQAIERSGFFNVLEEALEVDPENPVFKP